MNWQMWLEHWAYPTIFIAAAVEGEVVFSFASVMVSLGKLDVSGVLLAGALGASAGDHFYFYAFRGRMAQWMNRIPGLARRRDAVTGKVRLHATKMILASRFLPGLRVSIPLACAYAGVLPLRFSVLNLISSFAWAAAVMTTIAYLGPSVLSRLGISPWWAASLPVFLVLGFFWWLGKASGGGKALGETKRCVTPGSDQIMPHSKALENDQEKVQ